MGQGFIYSRVHSMYARTENSAGGINPNSTLLRNCKSQPQSSKFPEHFTKERFNIKFVNTELKTV